MTDNKLLLSPKYKAFIRSGAAVEFLEGTTMAGKTTIGLFKFMLMVAQSSKRLHIIAAKDTGTAEKNIINKDLGIIDDFGDLVEYNGNGTKNDKTPHLLFRTPNGIKIIYVLGYDDRSKWKKVLGGQYGCLYIDEINTADIDFVRESVIRSDYTLATLNPDDPELAIYKEFINCARPLEAWQDDTPQEILDELKEEPKPGWVHWFFSFSDNLGLHSSELDRVLNNTPKGTKIYKNKVLGIRGRSTGLVFYNFSRARHVRTKEWAQQFVTSDRRKERFIQFTAGLDTAYSQKSADTIAMTFAGITSGGKYIELDERVYNNRDILRPLAPSDTVINFIEFLERNREEWGFSRNVFVDSADQATITEIHKYKRLHGSIYTFNNAWKSKMKVIDRINAQIGWFEHDSYFILDHCVNSIREMETYSWLENKDNTPEDRNDHCINSMQYGWIPYRIKIGADQDRTDNRHDG